jgi:Saxitoxin biosynthesis operon protein SxtJ
MAHEDIHRSHQVEGSSNRSFGIVFTIVFSLLGVWPMLHGTGPRWWACGIAICFAVTATLKPSILAVPNRLWLKFGLLLGKIVSPVALAILFYGAILPIGLLMRLTGNDPLRLRKEPESKSYWISRTPPGPAPDSMNNQF